MNIEYMREQLRNQYSRAQRWVDKVNRMSPNQVMAVYYRMKKAGTLTSAEQKHSG